MNTDFRVSVDFFIHHKTKKLKRRIGDAGVLSLLQLWAYVAKIKPDGDISSMSIEDIEIAASWEGEEGAFVAAVCEAGFMEEYESEYFLHEWVINNPWAAEATERSDKARFSVMASKFPSLHKRLVSEGYTSISREKYVRLTTSEQVNNERSTTVNESLNERFTNVNGASTPSPSPSPDPEPSPEPEPKNQGQKIIAAPPPYAAFAEPSPPVNKPVDKRPKPLKPPENTEPQNTSPEEREVLNVLRTAQGGYKYDFGKDLNQIRTLSVEFPHVDMLGEVKKMAAWLIDKPASRVKSPRSFMRNWIVRAANNTQRKYDPRAAPIGESVYERAAKRDPDEILREFLGRDCLPESAIETEFQEVNGT